MEELKRHFITSDREYREGEVFVYEQKFTVKDVKKAVFTATALGVYEAEINGVKIGKQMFAPGYSYYPRRVLYQTYEVSALLREGANTLRVYLGQGWYCGRFLCENKTQIYGEKPAVSWILKIEDAAGVRDIVSGEQTDELESPYGYAGEYDGEIYFADGRSAVIGHPVSIKNELDFALEPTLTEVALQEEMEVKEAKQTGNVTILDFGQNFAGIVEIDPSFLTNETIISATFRVEHRNAFAVFVYPTLKLFIPSFKLCYRNGVRALSVNQELFIKSAFIVAASGR